MKVLYSYKVKEGASSVMSNILNYAGQVDSRMDRCICRVTATYPVNKNIKPQYLEQYKNDRLYQIKVKGIDDKEFLVMESLLEWLSEVVVENTAK
ncbi:MAG TPA: hypothetical protein VNS32_22765 [Flavisolibacter sp.]|nr:hypothetical protein [Flavisolibacter sp.]